MSGFTVSARTIFHLGAELISSDAVALYELVKNAFDAGSESVGISVVQSVPTSIANNLIRRIAMQVEAGSPADEAVFISLREEALRSLPDKSDHAIREAVEDAADAVSLLQAYVRVNEIVVHDMGEGMSLDDLSNVFLTIGTTSRKKTVDAQRSGSADAGPRPILGEKGVGRLSTMRLGMRLDVETAQVSDTALNVLSIDWSLFERAPDALLESISFVPKRAGPKVDVSGTTIRITQLTSDWTLQRLEDIAREQFSRLNDPFSATPKFPIDLLFNATAVPIPPFRKLLLSHAHAVVKADFGPEDPDALLPNGQIRPGAALRLRGSIDYRMRHRILPIDLGGLHLRSAANATDDVLRSLGPFSLAVYWFNRQALERIDTIGEVRQVQRLVNEWSGGVMVYRDGFRAGAYGQGADDWLDLDRKALASGGYKVNRAQIIGRLSISSVANPRLVDQTNREGLRDSPEKSALIAILKHVLEGLFRPFLNKVEEDIQAREPVDLTDVADRVLSQRRTIAATLRSLYQKYPEVKADPQIGGRIEAAMNDIGELMRSLESLGASYEKARKEMTLLAGIGLSVSSVAHELRQATQNAVDTVDLLRRKRGTADLSTALSPLGAQLKTLLTRLKVLDPLVASGRQVKTPTELVEWVTRGVEAARPAFDRDNVILECSVIRRAAGDKLEVRIVQGMIVQVVGNLLDNARYWTVRARIENPRLRPRVLVEIDVSKREVRVSDNGPGVEPSMRETIFQAFVTTKPIGAGLGLGLFISKEIARYSGAELSLLDPLANPPGMSTTFSLSFKDGLQ